MMAVLSLILLLFSAPPASATQDPCAYCSQGRDCLQGVFDGTQQKCEDDHSSPYCQNRCGTSGGGGAHHHSSSCESSSGCMRRGSDVQNGGLSDLLGLSKDTKAEAARMKANQADRLDSANDIMDRWKKSLDSGSNKGGDRAAWAADRALVDKAIKNYDGKGDFSESLAKEAHENGIKRELTNYNQVKQQEEALNWQEDQNQKQIKTLNAMKEKTDARADYLVDLAGKSQILKADTTSNSASSDLATANKDGTKSSNEKRADGKNPNLAASGTGEDAKKSLARKLREELESRLSKDKTNDKDKIDQEALDQKNFSRDLTSVDSSREQLDSKTAVGSLLSDARSRAFSLAGSESDKEVRRLMLQLEYNNSTLRSEGVLDENTKDLFQRVHEAHESCEVKSCVALSKK